MESVKRDVDLTLVPLLILLILLNTSRVRDLVVDAAYIIVNRALIVVDHTALVSEDTTKEPRIVSGNLLIVEENSCIPGDNPHFAFGMGYI